MTIHLPAARETAIVETDRTPFSVRPRSHSLKSAPVALGVDDHDALRRVCVSILRRADYRVIRAETGDAALRQLEAIDVSPSVALIDASLPGLSGVETASELLRIAPELRVLLMRGYAPENVTQPSEGRHHFLQSPSTETHCSSRSTKSAKRIAPTRRSRKPRQIGGAFAI